MSHYVPSVRGDALILTHGRTGAMEDLILISAAVVLDGTLGGHVEVTGNRRIGLDRRRVAPGVEDPRAPALMADLRRRVVAVAGETPWDWFEHAGVFALARVTEELIDAGAAEPLATSRVQRLFRHRTLYPDPAVEAAARERLADVLTGRPAAPPAIALANALYGCESLEDVAGLRLGRRHLRAMADAGRSLDSGTRAVLATLEARRRRAAKIAA
jgi:hypothetical protein